MDTRTSCRIRFLLSRVIFLFQVGFVLVQVIVIPTNKAAYRSYAFTTGSHLKIIQSYPNIEITSQSQFINYAVHRQQTVTFSTIADKLDQYTDDLRRDNDEDKISAENQQPLDRYEENLSDGDEYELLREDLKRELLLLASITNRGLYTLPSDNRNNEEETAILSELVVQLESLQSPAFLRNRLSKSSDTNSSSKDNIAHPIQVLSEGDWDLILSTTHPNSFFSILGVGNLSMDFNSASSFFSSNFGFMNDILKSADDILSVMGENFARGLIHPSQIGRVRQLIRSLPHTNNDVQYEVINDMDIHLSFPTPSLSFPIPSLTHRKLTISVLSSSTSSSKNGGKSIVWKLKPKRLTVTPDNSISGNKGSSRPSYKDDKTLPSRLPLDNASKSLIDGIVTVLRDNFSLPFSSNRKSMEIPFDKELFGILSPVTVEGVSLTTVYVDEDIRITRDEFDNYHVWSRS